MMSLQREELYLLIRNNYYIILVLLLSGFLIKKLMRKPSHTIIPGSLGLPLIGETFSFLSAAKSTNGIYDFVTPRRQRYGDWFKTRLFGQIHVFAPSVASVKTIMLNEYQFHKTMVKSVADLVGKKSLSNLPVEGHKRVRHILSGPLSMDSLSNFVKKFDKLLSERFKKLAEEGNSFMLLDFNMKVTCDAMCDMLMSISDELLLNRIQRECQTITNAFFSFPVMIPGTRFYKGMKARERLMSLFKEIITNRRISKEPHEDFLQLMLLPADEMLDDSEIMDNILTLILGGQGTTSTAMMWSVKYLDENKQVQNMLREEQLSMLRSKPRGALLCLEDLKKMSYGSKVVKETLRMSNVVPWHPRVVQNDCNIQGFEIKKGWHVNVDATHIHYDPTVYKDPLHFNPSRFDEIHKPYSYIPYGSGPRTCLGINMANVAMLVFLHRLISGYKWTINDQDHSQENMSLIPILKRGVPITLTPL